MEYGPSVFGIIYSTARFLWGKNVGVLRSLHDPWFRIAHEQSLPRLLDYRPITTRWSGDVIRRTGAVSHNRARPFFFNSGSARVFGYTVYRGFLNRVYGILQLKHGYSVYHFLWISGIQYTMLPLILGIFGWIFGIFGYFGEFFSVILVYHYPPWPTLLIQHGRGEVRSRRFYLNVHSVTGNVVDTE